MTKTLIQHTRRTRRKRSIRKRLFGTADRPRLTVTRSNKHIYAQIIDDVAGKTLVSASSSRLEKGSDAKAAKTVGEELAKQAKAAGVETVCFDRNGYKFHGRVQSLADAAREKGLKF
jgi:large subunit ribosomal protein L18